MYSLRCVRSGVEMASASTSVESERFAIAGCEEIDRKHISHLTTEMGPTHYPPALSRANAVFPVSRNIAQPRLGTPNTVALASRFSVLVGPSQRRTTKLRLIQSFLSEP